MINWRKLAPLLIAVMIISTFIFSNVLYAIEQAELSSEDEKLIQEVKNKFKEFYDVQTVAAAEDIAGLHIFTPSFLPEGFLEKQNIMVAKYTGELRDNLTPTIITQTWTTGENGVMLQLIQSQTLNGLAGSHEEIAINGVQGEKQIRQMDSIAPSALSLCWRKGDTTFILFGILMDSMNEQIMLELAASLK